MERLTQLAVLTSSAAGWAERLAPLALTLLLTGLASGALDAQVISQEEALTLAFPGADIERRTAFLDDAQLDSARALTAGTVKIESSLVTYYVATLGGLEIGVAYFDAGRVRTLQQVLMVVVDTDDRITRVETLSFREPPEYKAPTRWLDLFKGRELKDIGGRGDIPVMTGATLTTEATTRAARRVLALHAVIAPFSRAPS